MADSTAEFSIETPLVRWAVGSFHAATLNVAFILVIHLTSDLGALLAPVGTLPGIVIYLVVLGLSWWLAGRALRSVTSHIDRGGWGALRIVAAGGGYGALTGVIVLSPLLLLFVIGVIVEATVDALVAFAFLGGIAIGIAIVIGGVIGLAFAVVDLLVVLAVRDMTSSSA